jgi:hypothetical protein
VYLRDATGRTGGGSDRRGPQVLTWQKMNELIVRENFARAMVICT